jgi:flagellar assembly protein FliH
LAKKIFRASEVNEIGSRVLISPPQIRERETPAVVEEQIEEAEEVGEFQAAEEFEEVEEAGKEIEEDKDKALEEAKQVREKAEEEAKRIREEAEETAFKVMQKNTIEARKFKEDAQAEADKILEEARTNAQKMEEDARQKVETIIQEARTEAYENARKEGFATGADEVKRLIDRLHVILNAAIDKKKNIIENTEKQLMDLVLLIARKVVKVISEAEKKVVIENAKEALKKVRSETEITIRVNTADLGLTTKNKRSFISMVEGLKSVNVEEDSRVDPGGCIIETSFGDIDARIQRQLQII